MKKLPSILSVLFFVQVVIVIAMMSGGRAFDYQNSDARLTSIDIGAIDQLVIEGDGKTVSLSKSLGEWVIEGDEKLPAKKEQVDAALDRLSTVKRTWPVASSVESHERFKVSDTHFECKITVKSGNSAANVIYIGSSPGFKKSHVRIDGEKDVFSLALNTYDFEVQDSLWLQNKLLGIDDISAVKAGDFAIRRDGDAWLFEGQGASVNAVDKDKARELSEMFSGLQVTGLIGAEFEQDEASVIAFELEANEQRTYQFSKYGEKYAVKSDRFNPSFEISKQTYEKAAGFSKASLQEKQEPELELNPPEPALETQVEKE